MTITGDGVVDGQGYVWWWYVILTGKSVRPDMFNLQNHTRLVVRDLYCRNSPQFHFRVHDVQGAHFDNVTIWVNITQQMALLRRHNRTTIHPTLGIELPTFPLNTDGIDPAGRDVLIENSVIDNFDDAV